MINTWSLRDDETNKCALAFPPIRSTFPNVWVLENEFYLPKNLKTLRCQQLFFPCSLVLYYRFQAKVFQTEQFLCLTCRIPKDKYMWYLVLCCLLTFAPLCCCIHIDRSPSSLFWLLFHSLQRFPKLFHLHLRKFI